jgi:hypothetical protein
MISSINLLRGAKFDTCATLQFVLTTLRSSYKFPRTKSYMRYEEGRIIATTRMEGS